MVSSKVQGSMSKVKDPRSKFQSPRSKLIDQMALSRSGEDKSDSMVSSLLRLCLPWLLSKDSSRVIVAWCTWKLNRCDHRFLWCILCHFTRFSYQYLWYRALLRTVPLFRRVWPEIVKISTFRKYSLGQIY